MKKIINLFNNFVFKIQIIKTRIKGLTFLPALIHKIILFFLIWLVSFENLSNLKKVKHPAIFVFNHNNYFETLLVPCVLFALCGRIISFLVHWVFLYLPFIGWAIRQIKPIPVYNRLTKLYFLKKYIPLKYKDVKTEALARIRNGFSLAIFPEAGCNRNPFFLKRGRKGVAEIAFLSGCQVVPIGIDFPLRIKKNKIPRLGRLILRFGEPITDISNLSSAKGKKNLKRFYQEVTNLIMQQIAILCGKRYDKVT